MAVFIAWSGFLGAWLLVAGPIYQAAIELEEEDVEREVIAEASANVEAPPRVSPWWRLLPPVAYLLHRRRGRVHRLFWLSIIVMLIGSAVNTIVRMRRTHVMLG